MFDPTPEERADFVVRLLEDQIRDAKQASLRGMPFRQWQQVARVEIARAIADAERRVRVGEKLRVYLIVTFACALTTIGFWGVVVSRSDTFNTVAAVVIGLAGLALTGLALGLLTNAYVKRWEAINRHRDWRRILDLSRRLHILRLKLEQEQEDLERELDRAQGGRPRPPGD